VTGALRSISFSLFLVSIHKLNTGQIIMDASIISLVEACTTGSDQERITFPQVVMQLIDAGVERYYADLSRSEKIYYLPSGESHLVPCAHLSQKPAMNFSTEGVAAAVRAIQGQTIKYQEFCKRIATAGCIGYMVSLTGRRVVYFGRTGDMHVEHFPKAKS
jgi:uncharacterized protein YbcV (DUF1398 family)